MFSLVRFFALCGIFWSLWRYLSFVFGARLWYLCDLQSLVFRFCFWYLFDFPELYFTPPWLLRRHRDLSRSVNSATCKWSASEYASDRRGVILYVAFFSDRCLTLSGRLCDFVCLECFSIVCFGFGFLTFCYYLFSGGGFCRLGLFCCCFWLFIVSFCVSVGLFSCILIRRFVVSCYSLL